MVDLISMPIKSPQISELRTGVFRNTPKELLINLHKGELIIMAAERLGGILPLAIDLALSSAVDNKIQTAFFTPFLDEDALIQRMIACHTKMDLNNMKYAFKLSIYDKEKIDECFAIINDSPTFIRNLFDTFSDKLIDEIKHIKTTLGIEILIIDDIQHVIDSHHEGFLKGKRLSEFLISLKTLAKVLNLCIIVGWEITIKDDDSIDLNDLCFLKSTSDTFILIGSHDIEKEEEPAEVYIFKNSKQTSQIEAIYNRKSESFTWY